MIKITFFHPCDKELKISRKVPKIGSSKSIIPFSDGEFEWYFTNYEYHFCFHFKNDGKHKLSVCSGNPRNCFDWSEMDNVYVTTF